MKKNNWWDKQVLRSVDNLQLWSDNPRFDTAHKLVSLRDYVEELIKDQIGKQDFMELIDSIAHRGFISLDPIIVWQNPKTKKFVVAEGNRRVMALKLLRNPNQAPVSIRRQIVSLSSIVDKESIEKIYVRVAPSHESAHWYILQRHSPASNQVRWQRLQQQRFIQGVYYSTGHDLKETIKITGFKRASIVEALRYVEIREMANSPEVLKYLNEEQKKLVQNQKISMTVLERWFGNSRVREAWQLDFSDEGVTIMANKVSFYKAYAEFLKLILNKNNNLGYKVNTRTIDAKFKEIFDSLPLVVKGAAADTSLINNEGVDDKQVSLTEKNMPNGVVGKTDFSNKEEPSKIITKNNPKRRQLTDKEHHIKSDNYRLQMLFGELQELPVYKYPSVAAVILRVFLELAVDDYILSNNLDDKIKTKEKKSYNEIQLRNKIVYLLNNNFTEKEIKKTIEELLNNSNERSLNTLNEFVHSDKSHKIEAQSLNRFWDMLYPLLSVLIGLELN